MKVLKIFLCFCLLLPLPAFSEQGFGIFFDGWTDINGNGLIDCSEPVTYRIALFQDAAPVGPETGRISVPFTTPARWRYTPGSIRPDFILLDSCIWSIVQGDDPNDLGAVLTYSCDPLDSNYAFQFRVSGEYLGGSVGPIIVDARNDREFPTVGGLRIEDANAGPLNPCVAPPDLRLTKTVASGDGSPGSLLIYDLSVANFGNGPATSVVLQETVPQLASFDSANSSIGWTCSPDGNAGSSCSLALGSLGVGASATRTFAVRVASSFPPSPPQTIDNTACAVATPDDDRPDNNCGSTTTPAGSPDLSIAKSLGSGNGNPGSVLIYNLVVSNVGIRSAAGVVLQESVPQLTTFLPASSSPGWTCTPDGNAGSSCTLAVGSVAVGTSATFTFAVRAASTFPANPPAIDNTACVTTTSAGDPGANNCGTTSTPPQGSPDLRLTKSVVSGTGDPGATIVYGLLVENLGNRDAAGVELTETVPALATFLSASSSPGWTCSPDSNAGSHCTLPLGTVAAGTPATRAFAVKLAATFPTNPPSIDNVACSSTATSGDPQANNCGSTSTRPAGRPDLRTQKSVLSGVGDPGATLVYSIQVENLGDRDAAGVALTETVPGLSSFLASASSPGWSCSPNNGAGAHCTLNLGTLAAGASASRSFAVQLAATFPSNPPSIDNIACSSTTTEGDLQGNNCGSTATPPGGNPDVRLVKSVASGSGNPGETLVYQLVVTNAGTRDAAGVALEETVPQLTTFLPAGSSPGWTCTPNASAGSSCTLTAGTVAAGASATFTFAVQVASTFPANPPAIGNTACVSTTSGGDPSGNDCGTTSTPPGGNPDLTMSKSVASGSGDPGSVLVYQLAVSNTGTRDAVGVALEESVPQLTSFLTAGSSPGWTCTPDGNAGSSCRLSVGTLAAGSSATFTFAVQVASTFPSNPPEIGNTACVSTTSGGDPSGNDCGTTSTPPGGNPDVRMEKSVASGSGDPGSVLVYRLLVTNAGTREAVGVSLEETVPQLTSFLEAGSSPGWTCTPDGNAGSSCTLAVGTVAAGSSTAFTFAVQVASAFPPNPPPIANTACVSTASRQDPADNDCGTTSTPPGGIPDLRLVKSVASGSATPGSVLVYELQVSNIGTLGAAGVSLEETVPQLTTFLPASSSPGWTCTPDSNAGSSCTLAVGTVAAGASATFTFAVEVASTFPPNPPAIENSACVSTTSSGDPSGNDCGSTSTPPGGSPDLRLTKSVASGSASPGSVLVYELQVSNLGTQGAAGVSLKETVPQLTTFLAASSSPGWTCTPGNNAGSSCTLAVGTVAAGTSATFTFAVEVASTFPPNPPAIENSACVSTTSGGDPSGNDCGSTSTPPGGSPDLRLEKSVASGTANPGSVLVYSLEVSNIGTRDAADVSLEETVPQLTTFLPASSSPGWTCSPGGSAGSSCTLAVGTVAAGSSTTFTFAVQVARSFPPNPPPIENSACVSTSSGGDPSGNDCGSTSTPPGGSPDLALQKSLASGTVVPDGVLVFTLSLHNQGDAEATGVVLQETVPVDSTFEAASSSPGWSCTPDGSAGSHCTVPVGTVGAGVSESFTFAVRLRSDLPLGARVTNAACVEQATAPNDPEDNDCSTIIVDPPGRETRTDIELALAVDDRELPPGVPFVFTLTVRNASAVAAHALKVSVSLPSFGTQPTELDPACRVSDETTLECSIPELAASGFVQLTWKQPAFQVGEYTVSAELREATPEDVDSTPGNGVKTEDDYAEVSVSASADAGIHDIPTLSTVGISVMVLLLVTLAVVFLRRGSTRSAA